MSKGPEMLKAMLIDFENDIMDAVEKELKRIGRKVSFDEFKFIPFIDEVRPYVHSIFLDDEVCTTVSVSLDGQTEKDLSAFLSDNEIIHWDMIALVELLKAIDDSKSTNNKSNL
jgi:hypothetical protein